MAGDKRKGKAVGVEPRKKTRAEKEADRARAAAIVAERRTRCSDPPFRIREPAPAQAEQAEGQIEQAETEAAEPEVELQQGPRRSRRARTQDVPVLSRGTSSTSSSTS